MSSSRCLRSAFEACRPSKISHLPLRPLVQRRTFADKPTAKDLQGVLKPSSLPQKQPIANSIPESDPPKRSNPPVAQPASTSATSQPSEDTEPQSEQSSPPEPSRPVPLNVRLAYLAPQKHPAPYGVPVASLQLRSFSVRNLEFFSDFALRAAFYLNLSASGPVPLPKRIERWTMPKASFIFKKTQENFERITYKRNITIMDGEKSVVEVWLAVLRKWQFHGVGMKANVWEWEGVDVASKMDAQAKDLEKEITAKLGQFAWNKTVADTKSITDMLAKQGAKHVAVPMTEVRNFNKFKFRKSSPPSETTAS